MYGIFTYIYPKNDPNVGKYSIHGAPGYLSWMCYHHLPFHGIPSVSWCRLSGPLGGGMLPGGTWQGDLHRSADGESQIDDLRFSMSPCEKKNKNKV